MSKRRGYKGQTCLGKSIINARIKQRLATCTASRAGLHTVEYGGNKTAEAAPSSILERNQLEDLIATAELARSHFEAERRPDILSIQNSAVMKTKAPRLVPFPENEIQVRVLRRPKWSDSMTPEDLTDAEHRAFLEWRRDLAILEEQRGMCLSPYEKNVDFWRQLWRTIEKSDVVVQIVDARDPLFFYCEDLFKYVDEVSLLQNKKKHKVLLFNKADYVPQHIRDKWRNHFQDSSVQIVFFSALAELNKSSEKPVETTESPETSQITDCTEYQENPDDSSFEIVAPELESLQEESSQPNSSEPSSDEDDAFLAALSKRKLAGKAQIVKVPSTAPLRISHTPNEEPKVEKIQEESMVGQEVGEDVLNADQLMDLLESFIPKSGNLTRSERIALRAVIDAEKLKLKIVHEENEQDEDDDEWIGEEDDDEDYDSEESDDDEYDDDEDDDDEEEDDDDEEEEEQSEYSSESSESEISDSEFPETVEPVNQVIIGMTGFPNVGKSTAINALVGSKKVSMSRQPGKTKHIQTLHLNDRVTLCDCPGLVMPSVVASKAHLVINGTVPLDHIRDPVPSIQLIISRVGLSQLVAHYGCEKFLLPEFKKLGDARAFLCAYAVSRKYFLTLQLPDEFKSARMLLKDFCRGAVVHSMLPPGETDEHKSGDLENESDDDGMSENEEEMLFGDTKDAEEIRLALEDINMFMEEHGQNENAKTKRALRMDTKMQVKGSRRFAGQNAVGKSSFRNVELVVKPGQKNGRIGRAQLDPYGCHRKDEFFI